MKNGERIYHLVALITVSIWGTTFISTKVLLSYGLGPADILFYRFLMAYAGIWIWAKGKLFANSVRDELMMLGCGVCGGSLYFVTENTALGITLASNVSVLLCTAPILTAFLSHLLIKGERLGKTLIAGSLIALVGVVMVVYNGPFVLHISPLGDFLTFVAALSWAFYNILLKKLEGRYSTFFITRKVFFYGILTMLPCFLTRPPVYDAGILFRPVVAANLLFLGLIASMLCFIAWNSTVRKLGTIRSTNYIYITPLVTLITSYIVLDEVITSTAILGMVLVLVGVRLAEKGWNRFFSFRS